VLLKLNVPQERLDDVLAVLPAMSSPDGDGDGVRRHAGARDGRAQAGRQPAHPVAQGAGARDILELPISKIVE
jgi:ATP phosphoribosyltransferase